MVALNRSVAADDPLAGLTPYELRHLAAHLSETGRRDDLDRLLALSTGHGSATRENAWFAAHDAVGDLAGYLADVDRAAALAHRAAAAEVAAGRPVSSMGAGVRDALLASSVRSMVGGLPTAVVARLVEEGVWTHERAMDEIGHLTDLAEHAYALAVLSARLAPADAERLENEAVQLAKRIRSLKNRGAALLRLVPHLSGRAREAAFGKVLEILGATRPVELPWTEVAPRLTDTELASALSAAQDRESSVGRSVLWALAPHLPEPAHTAVVDELRARPDIGDHHSLLEARPAVEERARLAASEVAAIRANDYLEARARHLAAVAPFLDTSTLVSLVSETLVMKEGLEEDEHWMAADALVRLVPCLPTEQAVLLIDEAVAAVADVKAFEDADGLVGLVPVLPDRLLPDALSTALRLDDGHRREAVSALAPRLDRALLAETVQAMRRINDDGARVSQLSELSKHLPDGRRAGVLELALSIALGMPPGVERDLAVVSVIGRASPEWLAQARQAASQLKARWARADALLALVSSVPAGERLPLVDEALAAVEGVDSDEGVAHRLVSLAAIVPDPSRTTVVARALDITPQIIEDKGRASVLAQLVEVLPDELVPRALALTEGIEHGWSRADALSALAPRLSSELAGRAVTAALNISDEWPQSQALEALIPLTPVDVLEQVTKAVLNITNEWARSSALRVLIPRLPLDLLEEVTKAVPAMKEAGVDVRLALARRLHGPEVPKDLLDEVWAYPDPVGRANRLVSLMPGPIAVEDILNVVAELENPSDRAGALTRLIPHVDEEGRAEVLRQALLAVGQMEEPSVPTELVQALAALAPPERERLVSDVLAIVNDQPEPVERRRVLRALVGPVAALPPGMRVSIWVQFLSDLARRAREDTVNDLTEWAGLLALLGGEEAVDEAVRSVIDVGLWFP